MNSSLLLPRRSVLLAGMLLLGAFSSSFAAETNVVAVIQSALDAHRNSVSAHLGSPVVPSLPSARVIQVGQGLSRLPGLGPKATTLAGKAVDPDTQQRNAIRLLQQQVGSSLRLHLRPENQTVVQLRGGTLEARATGVALAGASDLDERTARSFLRRNRALLRLADPDTELVLSSRTTDSQGRVHLRFGQVYQGVMVWPSGLAVHLDARGNVDLMDGAYAPTPRGVGTIPSVTSTEASARALAVAKASPGAKVDVMGLVVYAPLGGKAKQSWKVEVTEDLAHAWVVLVDAQDGTILHQSSRVCTGGVVGSGQDMEGLNRKLNVWEQNGTYFMIDSSKKSFDPAFDPVKDAHGAIVILDARNSTLAQLQTNPVYQVTAPGPTQWSVPDAVSAAYNFSETYDYFLERHNRNSLDGKAGTITAIVRIGEYDNASWNGNLKLMVFGSVKPYPKALDVVGHELTHGVTENSAGLVYENQSGALNESFSDILGEMVEGRTAGKLDWLLGEKLGKVFRDFKNPGSLMIGGSNKPYPSKMSEFLQLPNNADGDHGGVHINSSIINHAFYLVAEGLPGAIGAADAEKIFYQCLTQHLQPQSQFIDARLGCIATAEALYGAGSTQAKKVAEAFDAVEIYATPSTPEPTPVPVVQGADSVLFAYVDPFFGTYGLGRRETALGDGNDGVVFADGVRLSRPAISGDGTYALFVSSEFDLCGASTDNPNDQECLGVPGYVHAVALSPDSRLGAYILRDPVSGLPEDKINVVTLASGEVRTFGLVAPIVDGTPVDAVLYADALAFSTDGTLLIYDAVSRLQFAGGQKVERSSIYGLNLTTDSTFVIVPPLESLDTGNPSVGRAGNRYLVFEAFSGATGNSTTIVLDLFSGEAGAVGLTEGGLAYPCFTGDEKAVVYSASTGTTGTGFSLAKQTLTPDRLTPDGAPVLWLSDSPLGVIYRRGAFTGTNALPAVTLTSPAPGASFDLPATITLQATASDVDGTISVVEFYDGATKLGEAATAPYKYTWTGAGVGEHRLSARAFDNLGGAEDSAQVVINVRDTTHAPSRISAVLAGGGLLRITLTGAAGEYAIQRSTSLGVPNWADRANVTIPASGTATIEETVGTAAGTYFYRVRSR